MSEKRKRDAHDTPGEERTKKSKSSGKGFKVDPDNLPDGAYKRKVKKIKASLIEKAKIKKDYSKVKQQRQQAEQDTRQPLLSPAAAAAEEAAPEPSNAMHPDRQTLMDEGPAEVPEEEDMAASYRPRQRRPKAIPFKREYEQAQQRQAEAEERRKAREEAEAQRLRKVEERERFRKAMAKAHRGGPNGQKKLGRESVALLERVKRMVGEDGG